MTCGLTTTALNILYANVSTFLGDLGMVIHNQDINKDVVIHVFAQDHSILIGNSLTVVKDKPVFMDVFDSTVTVNVNTNNKLTKDESAWLYISTKGFGIKVRFYKKHLDVYVLY